LISRTAVSVLQKQAAKKEKEKTSYWGKGRNGNNQQNWWDLI